MFCWLEQLKQSKPSISGGVCNCRGKFCRYQQEQREQRSTEMKLEKEKMEASRLRRLEQESALRDKLIRNVHHLEQRKMEVQRELLLRSLMADGQSQLKSAVVIPK